MAPRQFADERVDIDFKDMADRMRLGVRYGPKFLRLRPLPFQERLRVAFGRIGQQSHAEIQ